MFQRKKPYHLSPDFAEERMVSYSLSIILFFFWLLRATAVAYGSSQARHQIRATPAGDSRSHSNAGSELCLQPTPQLMTALDPQPAERGKGLNPHPHGY